MSGQAFVMGMLAASIALRWTAGAPWYVQLSAACGFSLACSAAGALADAALSMAGWA